MKTKQFLVIISMVLILVLMGCAPAGIQAGRGPGANKTLAANADTKEDETVASIAQESPISTETQSPIALQTDNQTETLPAVIPELAGFGSEGALADKELTLKDMLTYAIQDEYLAHAEYTYIIEAYGNQKPFSNIIKAEEMHISELEPLFRSNNFEQPKDTANERIIKVGDIPEAVRAGETAEVNNIAMYDIFLKQELPDDVRTVFESLKKASVNHLAAFRRQQ